MALALVGMCAPHERPEARDVAISAPVSSVQMDAFPFIAPDEPRPTRFPAARPAIPKQCETFEVHISAEGKQRYRRKRGAWTKADRRRFKALVEMVAREMGAEPKLFTLWALRESTFKPSAIHVLNPDLQAAHRTWASRRYTESEAGALRARMAVGPQKRDYWRAQGRLRRIETFRDNPHFGAQVVFDVHTHTGETLSDRRSAWAFGYGPFGFNPTYYVPVWDAKAPPWVFCYADGIPAVVTAVWAARSQQRECESQGLGGTYEDVNRRFSSGHCRLRPGRAHYFQRRARSVGLDYASRARLGSKWPSKSTSRDAVLAHMVGRARALGLMSDE